MIAYRKKLLFFSILIILAAGLFWFSWRSDVLESQVDGIQSSNPSSSVSSQNRPSPSSAISQTPRPNSPSPSPTPRPSAASSGSILLDVPFFAQAPFGEWDNPLFQDGCEEASVIMAWQWVLNQSISKEEAKQEILAISAFEDKTYGPATDRSATDTARLMRDYYGYQNISVRYSIGANDIKQELLKGNLVIAPVNGQILKNPFYSGDGPEHHMIVIIGYDAVRDEFITNDVGTRHGEKFRYSSSRLESALQDYPTGDHLPFTPGATALIVVEPA